MFVDRRNLSTHTNVFKLCIYISRLVISSLFPASMCRIRQQLVHMMVDTSHPLSRGALFNDIFSLQQEPLDQLSLQRLLIRSILHYHACTVYGGLALNTIFERP